MTARFDQEQQRPVVVETPPPPQRTVYTNHYVPIDQDKYREAHQWASEQLARRYPGSIEHLHTLESLIQQRLAAT